MKVVLVQTGRTIDRHLNTLIEVYSSRIRRYSGFEIITIPATKNTKNMPVNEQVMKEGKKILQSVGGEDHVILLDERGKELSTNGFSELLKKILSSGKKRLVFVTGGPWGFSEEVYARGDMELSLSRMTFPHQLVRLLFLEQLYRAFTIIKGEPYHHE